jgi:condensin complex subunit 1
MRNGLIEIVGMLIDQLSQLDFTENLQVQIDHFFDVIEERFRDNNSLVRSKLLQVVAKIAE